MKIYRFDLHTRRIATMSAPLGDLVPSSAILTSRPYAVEVDEALDAAGVVSRMRILMSPVDSLDAADAVIVSGLLREVLKSTTLLEAIDASVVISSGLLREILRSTSLQEAVDGDGVIVSGSLRTILITTTMAPESIDAGAPLIVAGTLT